MEYYKKYDNRTVITRNTVDALIGDFYSHLYYNSNQDSSTTAAHITDTIHVLVTQNIITQYVSIILEGTDGCTNQYRCATAFTSYHL